MLQEQTRRKPRRPLNVFLTNAQWKFVRSDVMRALTKRLNSKQFVLIMIHFHTQIVRAVQMSMLAASPSGLLAMNI